MVWEKKLVSLTLFSLLMVLEMTGSGRAYLPNVPGDTVSVIIGSYVPHSVTVDFGGILNCALLGGEGSLLAVELLPREILMWTVKLFFYSTTFQRFMSRYWGSFAMKAEGVRFQQQQPAKRPDFTFMVGVPKDNNCETNRHREKRLI